MAAGDIDKTLRDMAQVRGFKLVKSRRRKPGGDFGRYGLKDAKTGKPCFGMGDRGLKASAEDVASFLRGQAKDEWKSSLSAPAIAPKPTRRRAKRRLKDDAPSSSAPARKRMATAKPVAARLAPESVEMPPKPKAKLVIREAKPADTRDLAALMDNPPPTRRLAATIAALAKQGMPVMVAEEESIVGVVGYDVMTTLQHAAPIGRITLLVTAKPERRRGIGGRLLKEAEARLRKLGCRRFELINAIELSNANSFLREHGYQRSGYRFERDAGKR